MSPDRRRLMDMLSSARDAQDFLGGLDVVALEEDRKTQAAVIRAIEVIGEAANKVTAERRAMAPEIPWPNIIGLRNILIHDYGRIDLARLRATVLIDIPVLIAALERLLAETSE